jgi:hypothetical protein
MIIYKIILGTIFIVLGFSVSAQSSNLEFLFNENSYSHGENTAKAAVARFSNFNKQSDRMEDFHSSKGLQNLARLEESLLEQARSLSAVSHLVIDQIVYDETKNYACVLVHCIFFPSLRLHEVDLQSRRELLSHMNHTRVYSMKYDESASIWILGDSGNPAYAVLQSKVDVDEAVLISSDFIFRGFPVKFDIIKESKDLLGRFIESKYNAIDQFNLDSSMFESVNVSFEKVQLNEGNLINDPVSAIGKYMYAQKTGSFNSLLKIALGDYRRELSQQAADIPQSGIERLMRKGYGQFGYTYVIALEVNLDSDKKDYICLLSGKSIAESWNVVGYNIKLNDLEDGFIRKISLGSNYTDVSSMFRKVYDVWISEYFRGI